MIEACFKAFARALRIAVAIDPDETGVPVDQGHADVTVALVDYGMGNRRSVEKALEHVGARVARTADHDDDRRPPTAIVLPGRRRVPARRCARLRALGLDELLRERAARGRAAARHLPRHAAALRLAPTSTRAPTGLGLLAGHRHAAATRPG